MDLMDGMDGGIGGRRLLEARALVAAGERRGVGDKTNRPSPIGATLRGTRGLQRPRSCFGPEGQNESLALRSGPFTGLARRGGLQAGPSRAGRSDARSLPTPVPRFERGWACEARVVMRGGAFCRGSAFGKDTRSAIVRSEEIPDPDRLRSAETPSFFANISDVPFSVPLPRISAMSTFPSQLIHIPLSQVAWRDPVFSPPQSDVCPSFPAVSTASSTHIRSRKLYQYSQLCSRMTFWRNSSPNRGFS